jgi:lysophospholipase L1-like esterase
MEAKRVKAYERPMAAGPVRLVHVAASGDSWFDYVPAWDILTQLRTTNWSGWEYEIKSTARRGNTLNEMVYGRTMVDTYQMLHTHPEADVFLFSGGGNDLTNDQMLDLLYNHAAVDYTYGTPEINKKVVQGFFGEILYKTFDDLIRLLRFKMAQIGKPNMPIIFHGYAYPFPDGRGWTIFGAHNWAGPWLDPPLSTKGYDRKIDKAERVQIVRDLIDIFNDMLAKIVSTHPNTHCVDLRPITLTQPQWHNELHPREPGFLKVTQKIEEKIRAVV